MATVMYIPEKKQSLGAMKGVMSYVCQEKKTVDPVTGQRFVTGVHCLGDNAFQEFLATKRTYGKTKGMNFYQYVQSFSPKEAVTLEKAHAIALEFAQKAWPGFEVLVATHRDAGHLHSHFVVNSVSWETGLKLRQSPKTLQTLRALSDEICAAQGLSVLPRYEKPGAKLSSREYRAAQKGESWKFQLMGAITQAMERSGTRRDFLRAMERRGYQVAWRTTGSTSPTPPPADESAGTSDYIKTNSERRTWSMNSPSEKNTSDSLLQALLEKNTQDLAEIQLKPYTPTVYAIPDTIWTAMINLLQNAATFQPTLYQKLQPLATWEEVQELAAKMEETQEQTVQKAPVAGGPEQPAGPVPNPGGTGEGASQPGDVPTTGWEGARAVYFQAVPKSSPPGRTSWRTFSSRRSAGGGSFAEGLPWGCCSPGPWPAGHCGCCCGDGE